VVEPATGGKALLRVAAGGLDPLIRFATGIGFGFEVLDPPELRTAVRDRADEIAARHSQR